MKQRQKAPARSSSTTVTGGKAAIPQRVLKDHKRVGKKFIPPFIAQVSGAFEFVQWIDQLVPELVWVALAVRTLGERRAAEALLACARGAQSLSGERRTFCFASDYEALGPDEGRSLRAELDRAAVLGDLRAALGRLVCYYPICPLAVLFEDGGPRSGTDLEGDIAALEAIARDMLDRRSRIATIAQANVVYVMGVTGRIKVREGLQLESLEPLVDYPKTEDSKRIAASVRAAVNAFGALGRPGSAWPSAFWRQGFKISACKRKPTDAQTSQPDGWPEKLQELARRFRQELFGELQEQWDHAPIDLSPPVRDEVLGALLARQARLCTAIATSPSLWSLDLAKVILRCMAETQVVLTWLAAKGAAADFDRFVEYGLGQEKLQLEHIKSRMDQNDSVMQDLVTRIEDWIDAQRYTALLPVDVSNWTSKTIRQMAEEAGCPEVHSLVYAPFSSAVHGMWNTVEKLNLEHCTNPLHRYHRVPRLSHPPIFLGSLDQAAQIMDDTFRAWEAAKGVVPLKSTASSRYRQALADSIGQARRA